jgi:hypothetical protein
MFSMTKRAWLLAVLSVTVAPVACVVSLGGPEGPGGSEAGGPGGPGGGHGFGGHSGSGGHASSGGDTCNPVTGAGCPSDGTTCDLGQSGFFQCFPPPNTVDVCGVCDDAQSFCGSDLTCVLPSDAPSGTCYRYCCTDADCGSGAVCDTKFGAEVLQPNDQGDAVGLCVTNTSDEAPACGTPTAAPSAGSCVAGFPGGDGGMQGAGGGNQGTGGGNQGTGGGGPEDGGSMFPDGGHAGRHDGGFGH